MKIDLISIDRFKADALKALESLKEKYGVEISFGGGIYAREEFSATLKVKNVGGAEREFERLAAINSSYAGVFNEKFNYKDHEYTVTGIKEGNNFPIICIRDDGKEYGFRLDDVKKYIELY